MSCCPSNITTFSNATETVIGYSDSLRETFGRVPKIEVYYRDPIANDYYISNNQSAVSLIGNPVNQIKVNHGGPASGAIKIA